MGTVKRNVEDYILVGEDDKRIQEHPPRQQHEEVQRAEVKLPFLGLVGTQSHRRHERHDMNKEDQIPHKRFG